MTRLLTKLAKVLVGQLREMLTPKQLQPCPEVVRRSVLFAAVAMSRRCRVGGRQGRTAHL